jgi:hypothetical protein
MSFVAALAIAFLFPAPQAAHSQGEGAALDSRDLEFLCSLPPGFTYRTGTPLPNGNMVDGFEWSRTVSARRTLPLEVSCPSGLLKLRGATDGLTQLGFSADGSLAVLSGGYAFDPLNGQGGDCFFTRSGRTWSLRGCAQMWVS